MTSTKQCSKKLLRGNRKYVKPEGDLELQIVDMEETIDYENKNMFQMCIFAIDAKSNSYCVKVNNYKPFYYIEVPKKVDYKVFVDTLLQTQLVNKYNGGTRYVAELVAHPTSMKSMVEKCKYKIFDGYRDKKSTVVKVSFNNLSDYKALNYHFKENKLTINKKEYKLVFCESNIPPMLRFCHEKDIKTAGWIKIQAGKYEVVSKYSTYSTCQYEVIVDQKDVYSSNNMNIGKIIVASFDIETYTPGRAGFPVFTNKKDSIVQIGTTVEMYGEKEWSYRYIATLGECNEIENCEVVKCKTEQELIIKWAEFIRTLDPDIITGYNILGYDFEYLFERAMLNKVANEIAKISRVRYPLNKRDSTELMKYNFTSEITEYQSKNSLKKVWEVQKLSSSALGDNILKSIVSTGRIALDLLKYCRDSGDKLPSYKLDFVAKHYGLDQGKNDMPYKEIFRIYREGTPEEKKRVAEYCIQDCKLCNQLLNKLNIVPNCIGMATTCSVPLRFLFTRGQGIKTYSLLVKEATQLGYVIPVKDKKDPGGYKGATVLSARAGAHFYPVTALDFASLYPSCMISHNICISSKMTEAQIKKMNLHETDYRVVEWDEEMTGEDIVKYMAKSEEVCEAVIENYPDFAEICQSFHFVKEVVYDSNPLKEKVRQLLIEKVQHKEKYEAFFTLFKIKIDDISTNWFEEEVDEDSGKSPKKYLGVQLRKRHYYIQPKMKEDGELEDEERGVLPKILQKLLDKRNATKKLKAQYKKTDPFLSDIYDGLQLAYKVTANSVYGQLGAPTGNFANVGVAASVTTTGRQMLEIAETFIKKNYKATPIYGDTDSVFMKYQLRNHSCDCPNHDNNRKKRIEEFYRIANEARDKMIKEKTPFLHTRQATTMLKHDYEIWQNCNCPEYEPMSEEALKESIKLGAESDAITTFLLPDRKRVRNGEKVGVQQLEYEKTYQPYILFSKKRYVGKLYEFNTKQEEGPGQGWKLDYKGIVLKRRDNCGLLKLFYKKCLMKILSKDIDGAVNCLDNQLKSLVNNHNTKEFGLEYFTLSKTLKALENYKPDKKTGKISQAHVMLAQRMKERDPGSAPQTNERVQYCFIEKKGDQKSFLQGDLIENPQYIEQENLKLDYTYYIKKQLKTPIEQLFKYVAEEQVKSIFTRVIKQGDLSKKGLKPLTSIFGMKKKTEFTDFEKKKMDEQKDERKAMALRLFEDSDDEDEEPKKKKSKTIKKSSALKKPEKKTQLDNLINQFMDEDSDDEEPVKPKKKAIKKKAIKKNKKSKSTETTPDTSPKKKVVIKKIKKTKDETKKVSPKKKIVIKKVKKTE